MSFRFFYPIPLSQGCGYFPPVTTHLSHPLIQLLQTAAYYLAHFGARRLTGAFFGNHALNLIKCETERLRALNKIKTLKDVLSIKPVTAFGSGRAVE
jgi:hypothetical protein